MKYRKLLISLVLPQIAGLIGSFFTSPSISTWYDMLEKPLFSPPNWIFGPVWVVLYLLMGISVFLVWNKLDERKTNKTPVYIFWLHLFFNALWSILFFGLQNPGLALINIIVIILFIIYLIVKYYRIEKISSYLLIPYLLWVSFATVLNYLIWYLN